MSGTNDNITAALDKRIADLERRNRLLVRWLVGLSAVAIALIACRVGSTMEFAPTAIAQESAQTRAPRKLVQSQAFEVVNKKGEVRMRLESTPDGGMITVFDREDRRRIEFGITHCGSSPESLPSLMFLGESGDAPLIITCQGSDYPLIAMNGPEQRCGLRLSVTPDAGARLRTISGHSTTWSAPPSSPTTQPAE